MESNVAELCGVVLSELRFSHKTYGEIFYTFVLGIERRSGYIDEINIMVSERLIFDNPPREGDFVEIKGQIRTYNEIVEKTGVSTATIGRVNRALSYGAGGYEAILKKVTEEKKHD